ncbi:MAG: hypothetical protein KA170_15025 [Candidatus Promineofilum sp.]|nr:hypothetical protein [Promineifilum sp.]
MTSDISGQIRRVLVGAALLVALWALAGCAGGNMAAIDVTLDKADDRATVTTEDGRVVIDVTSISGIGGLTATADEWPAEVVVRLRLRGLEGLEIRYGEVTIATGVSSSGQPAALTLSVVDENGNVQSASPSADIYYPDILAVTPDGTTAVGPLAVGERPASPLPEGSAFEITLPPAFMQSDSPSFALHWIDFYR